MIRFIFDSFGDAHEDIFIKIDTWLGPSPHIADFYFIPDFLEFESTIEDGIEWKKACFKRYLEYLVDQVNLNLDKIYLVFDLSDQYVSAIKLEKFVRSKTICYQTSIVYSNKYAGWGINYKMQQSEFIDSEWIQNDDNNWEISKDGLLEGMKWSIDNLACKTEWLN